MEYYTTDELYHWGVKGMKWGVRRYQNKDGSLTSAGMKRKAKLADYKKKEIARLDKTYDVSKYDKRISKYQEKYNDTGKERYAKKIDDAQFKKYQAIGLKAVENSAIKNMTYEQMKDEKHAVMINTGRNIVRAASTASIAVGGIVAGKLSNDASKLADRINSKHLLNSYDTIHEVNTRIIENGENWVDVHREVMNRSYNKVMSEHGTSGKILDKVLNATDTVKYAKDYNKARVSWVAQQVLDNATVAGYVGGPAAAAVKLGMDVVNGRYKTNASVKSKRRLSYQEQNDVDAEARKQVTNLKRKSKQK